ncbi:MAG TPA: DUF952 domain-containing protein [Streptosporangiaceae bacterium]|nr:DUF952 domain-containing protein [Streptosporangiaceae bacterium]
MSLIYHIARASDWERATRDGEYTVSTAGRTLAEEGFIHASQPHQVQGVRDAFFRDTPGLVLLVIDPDLVRAPVRYDAVPGEPDPFPHIYGPLNTDAVVEVRAL